MKYIAGNQNGNAYAHLYIHIRATLIGDAFIAAGIALGVFLSDPDYDLSNVRTGNDLHRAGLEGDRRKLTNPDALSNPTRALEVRASIEDDLAGGRIGQLLSRSWSPFANRTAVSDEIFGILCDR